MIDNLMSLSSMKGNNRAQDRHSPFCDIADVCGCDYYILGRYPVWILFAPVNQHKVL